MLNDQILGKRQARRNRRTKQNSRNEYQYGSLKFKKKSINILNMNRLSIPNKREKLTNYMKKKDFTTFYKR